MDLIVIYSGDFGEKVIGNLINYSTFCISCAEACARERIEIAFPKPFCELQPRNDQPLIKKFVDEFKIGRPEIRIEVDKRGNIRRVDVLRSAPCGSTWFVAKQLAHVEVGNIRELHEQISASHHSYPCTASMEKDPEIGDTTLHKAGYIIRTAVKEGIKQSESIDPVVG
jgi:hypothetical protein